MRQYFEPQIKKHGDEKLYFIYAPSALQAEVLMFRPEKLPYFQGEFVKYSGIIPMFKSYNFDGISFPTIVDKLD